MVLKWLETEEFHKEHKFSDLDLNNGYFSFYKGLAILYKRDI